jgi:hypothetical protein
LALHNGGRREHAEPITSKELKAMGEHWAKPAGTGLVVGIVGALGFAVVISLFPETWFTSTGNRALLYAAQVPAGVLFVLLARAVGRAVGGDDRLVLQGVIAGALLVDGLFIGFWPVIYGQEGEALTYTASLLLWAFAWIVIAGVVMNRSRSAGPSTP